jgi:hypothetical protein
VAWSYFRTPMGEMTPQMGAQAPPSCSAWADPSGKGLIRAGRDSPYEVVSVPEALLLLASEHQGHM